MGKIYDVIIIGGGAAGLFAACSLVSKNHVILEKNDAVGKKLQLAGSGKCNITNSRDIADFKDKYGENGKVIFSSLKQFSNDTLRKFLKQIGIETFSRDDMKVFPKSEKSSDVIAALRQQAGEIILNSPVNLVKQHNTLFQVSCGDTVYETKAVIVATGGKSFPTTGSIGDGYKIASGFGHKITNLAPALTPIFIENNPFKELSGVAMSDIPIDIYRDNKKVNSVRGDIGFTHFGVSGPGIIDASRYIQAKDTLVFNFSKCSTGDANDILIQAAHDEGKKQIDTILKKFPITASFISHILVLCGVESRKKMALISKIERKMLCRYLTAYDVEVSKIGDYNIAMATRGGVDLSEVSRKHYESKLIKNLFFIGEVLDIDGDTGGYNLQAAFSTALSATAYLNKI